MGLEFGILGPLEVRLDGELVRVGGPRQRALLALLLCSANEVVSRDRLIEELHADQPADAAERTLRVEVSRLRKALGADERLHTRPPGYLLEVHAGELDLQRFERLAADGQLAIRRGECEQAAQLLRQAESCWRGPPLSDLEYAPFAQTEISRLDRLRLGVVADRVDAELACGRHAALGLELAALVADNPLDERLRAQLMLALYRSGRQADALETYRVGRAQLVEELGLEPGPELRQLELDILAHDPSLTLPRVASAHRSANPPSPARNLPRMAVAAVALLAALSVLVVVAGFGSPARAAQTGNRLVLLGRNGRVETTIPLHTDPSALVAGFGSLWVAEPAAGAIVRIDPGQRRVTATIPVGSEPTRLLVAAGYLWVLDPHDGTLSGIDPRTNTVALAFAAGTEPSDLTAADGSLWVADRGTRTVIRLNPMTGAIEQKVAAGGTPAAVAAASGAVWVADADTGLVERIGAGSGRITARLRVGDAPAEIAATPAAIWIVDPLDATASRIDPRHAVITATVAVGGNPAAATVARGSVWIGDMATGTVEQLEPRTGTVIRRVLLDGPVTALGAGAGIWATIDGAGTGHRGGTLHSIASYAVIDTLDPASSTATNLPPPQYFGLTNDGLVSFDHAAGPAGGRLVPDLAVALPTPTDDGRTYTFRLRPGIRYSTGQVLRASDVTRSIERVFAIDSSGTSFFSTIAGAAQCLRTPLNCDLSRGIVPDDRAGTVTFHLTRPDPDLLYKLTIANAYILPASTPEQQARSPLPATGPYMTTSYVPGHLLVMTRNPYFRMWSAAAQPSGYPDRITIRLDLGGAGGPAQIARGASDFLPNLGRPPGPDANYFLVGHRAQVRIHPLLETSFMFLNTRAAPFNDVRVREALNLELDRRAIVTAYGGPDAATPTCQILPPSMPGYRPYCPYTAEAGPSSRWQAPDLVRARRLVTASHTAGMKITVWNSPGPPGAIYETRAAVTALDRLGYRATLRILPTTTYFTYTNDSRNGAQVIDGGWSDDYPSADDFIAKLTCPYFVPANAPGTFDASELCDPAVDQLEGRAAALQVTNPAAADGLWARLDRRLTNLAIWAPTVVPNEIDLISRRVGDYQYNPVWGALLDQLWVR